MPQISLYIDSETLSKIEIVAKVSNTSISEWVTERLKESLSNNWPENYATLFGAITDETFNIHRDEDFSMDVW